MEDAHMEHSTPSRLVLEYESGEGLPREIALRPHTRLVLGRAKALPCATRLKPLASAVEEASRGRDEPIDRDSVLSREHVAVTQRGDDADGGACCVVEVLG